MTRSSRTRKLDWARASRYSQDPSRSPGLQLWRQFLRWQRSINALLSPLGLTQPQFSLLAAAAWLDSEAEASGNHTEVSQQAVADFTGMDRMLVSQVVRRLEQAGLLTRTPSSLDGRVFSLSVTSKGVACLAKALPLVEEHDLTFFAGASKPVV